MATLLFTIEVARPPAVVFDLIADLAGYRAWLPPSRVFSEVIQLNSGPVKLGTAYVDRGPSLVFQGEVIDFEPPTLLTFYQATRSSVLMFDAGMNINIDYTLHQTAAGTCVERTLTLDTLGIFTLLQPLLRRALRQENERILQRMKAHLEAA